MATANGTSAAIGPRLDRREPSGTYVTTMEVVGALPITYNGGGTKRQSYRDWVAALDAAARYAAARARPATSQLFSLRCELRLYISHNQGSDLDNYVKPIQDALAKHGVFGKTDNIGSTHKGDERVDHLELRRRRVGSQAEAGVLAEVWALNSSACG
jgi:Holliday junction resolvase RusA-like endonuclease